MTRATGQRSPRWDTVAWLPRPKLGELCCVVDCSRPAAVCCSFEGRDDRLCLRPLCALHGHHRNEPLCPEHLQAVSQCIAIVYPEPPKRPEMPRPFWKDRTEGKG